MNSFSGLARSLAERPRAVTLFGAPEGHDAASIGNLVADSGGKTWLHVCRDDGRMARFAAALPFFHPGLNVLTFPAWDCLPYDRVSPNPDIVSRRIDVLTRLAAVGESRPFVLLTTVNAVVQRVPRCQERNRSRLRRMSPGVSALAGSDRGAGMVPSI
jgi:transcription-repair coupling factor (superfamily II helicase)